MIHRILNSQTKTIGFAAALLSFSALFSRILGLLRDRLLAGRFGAGEELDVYFAAFRIPDFVYGILIMGGLSAVFLPIFSEYFHKNKKEAWELTNNVLNVFFVLLIIVCGILAVFTPLLIKFLVAPGFTEENRQLTILLTRIMFLSPIFFGLSSVFSGILHYFNKFIIYSLAPVFYNLGIILGILFFVPIFGTLGLAWGVVLGALAHGIIQIPAARISGYKYRLVFNLKQEGLVKVFRLMGPRTIGAAAFHINLVVITAIASTLVAGSVTIFNFSNNLQHLPIGIIGSSFAIAVFPALSRAWAHGLKEQFLESFSSVFRQILFLVIPISVLMFLMRAQIVRLILGTGQFGWDETRLTAASLGIFCFGIFSFALIPFLARAFYSLQDTKTPVFIGIVSMGLNIALAFILVWSLGFQNYFQKSVAAALKLRGIEDIAVVGLPLALSVAGILQVSLLVFFLRRKLGDIQLREISVSFIKISLATLFMGIFSYLTLRAAVNFLNMQTFLGVFSQAAIAGLVGVFAYIIFSLILKSPEIKFILKKTLG